METRGTMLQCAPFIQQSDTMSKPARFLTFKCAKCAKPVKVSLQKVSACSHVQPYVGVCACGEVKRHATGDAQAVADFVATGEVHSHHHHH
jgi:hypothetical protein